VAAVISFILSQASAGRALQERTFHEGSSWRAVRGWEQMNGEPHWAVTTQMIKSVKKFVGKGSFSRLPWTKPKEILKLLRRHLANPQMNIKIPKRPTRTIRTIFSASLI